MTFLETIRNRAKEKYRTLVFPEGFDARTLEAAARLHAEGLARPIVLGGPLTRADLDRLGAKDVEVVDPEHDPRRAQLAARFHERRRAKGCSEEDALRQSGELLNFGALMV